MPLEAKELNQLIPFIWEMACIWVTAHQQMERFFPWPQDQASVSLTPLWDESYQRKVCACVWGSVEGGCSPISVKGFIFLSRLPQAFKVLLVPSKPAPFCINVCFSHESLCILCWHNWLNCKQYVFVYHMSMHVCMRDSTGLMTIAAWLHECALTGVHVCESMRDWPQIFWYSC